MLWTLKNELIRKNISLSILAESLGMSLNTLTKKINGEIPFTFREAVSLRKMIDSDLSLEDLFEEFE